MLVRVATMITKRYKFWRKIETSYEKKMAMLLCVLYEQICLTHWGRVTHICVSNLTIIGSDNGLSPGRRQAIIWTNAGILLIGPSGTNFSEILIEIHTFSINKMHLKMSSSKRRLFILGLNMLMNITNVAWCSVGFKTRPIISLGIILFTLATALWCWCGCGRHDITTTQTSC